jgi:hypothetical protein
LPLVLDGFSVLWFLYFDGYGAGGGGGGIPGTGGLNVGCPAI